MTTPQILVTVTAWFCLGCYLTKWWLTKSSHCLATKKDLELMGERIMAKIDDVLQDIADESTLEDSVLALLVAIKQQLADALSNTTVPADVQAKIDSAFAALEANKAKLTNAVVTNTPAATP